MCSSVIAGNCFKITSSVFVVTGRFPDKTKLHRERESPVISAIFATPTPCFNSSSFNL